MEVLAVITTVYTLAKNIHTWLEEHEERHATIRQISGTVSQIQCILSPLQNEQEPIHTEPQTVGAVRSIGATLKKTQEHLVVWEHRRSKRILAIFSPSTVIKQLRDDERLLSQQLILLLTSIAVVGFVQKQRKRNPIISKSTMWGKQEPPVLASIKHWEVKMFWRAYVGAELSYISGDEFCDRLGAAMGETFDVSMRRRLLLRLDEFDIGGVTPAALEGLIGTGNLRTMVNTFNTDSSCAPVPLSPAKLWWPFVAKSSSIALPLLVWIDDNPDSVDDLIKDAEDKGISVVYLTSTALAKAWIEANSDFLRRNDDPSKIRFISDNHRDEPNSGPYLNISAGENILRYLRGRQYHVPVLIYCGFSISQTTYVNNYHFAGSTNDYSVVEPFITSLSLRKSDDTKWLGFKSGGSTGLGS